MSGKNPADRFAYRVLWSEEDGEFVGLCSELPGLSWLARSPGAALRGIVEAARAAVREMSAAGESVPSPLATRRFSGQFRVRIPPQLHRRLAMEAADERVSLNRLVAAKLSRD